jgi:hypothetical protein
MPNIKEVLKEFVATANAGQYATENELLSKFPELSGYDANTLKEFVSTANAGQYESEDDLLSKFPEFGQPVKKKKSRQYLCGFKSKSNQSKSQNQHSRFWNPSLRVFLWDLKEFLRLPLCLRLLQ